MGSRGDSKKDVILDLHRKQKSLLKSDSLYEYMLSTTVLPREHECLHEIRVITKQHIGPYMLSGQDEMQLFGMLLKILNAKNTIEIGVFTGYSVLAVALALPDDGKVLAIDNNRKAYDLGLPLIQKAGVAHKIDFHEGEALLILDQLLSKEENKGKFEFAYVDADKDNYIKYHEQMLQLVKVGGLIAYDDTLWAGAVVMPKDELSEQDQIISAVVREFNIMITADQRVEVCQLSIADGVTLCRRLV